MKQLSFALMLLSLFVAPSSAQVSPRRELPQQQNVRRPFAPPQTFYLTNNLQRRLGLTNQGGVSTNAANVGATALPPGASPQNMLVSTNGLPVGITSTNARRLPPFGTNVASSRLPLTNLVSTNVLSTNVSAQVSTNAPRTSRPITPAQRIQIVRLTADLNAMRMASQITPAQKQQLFNTLRASALGPIRPSDEVVNQLVNDLLTVWPTQGFAPQQKSQLAIDLNRILNAGNLALSDTPVVINDARRIFQTSGMSAQAIDMVAKDLSLIAAQIQGGTQPEAVPAPGVAAQPSTTAQPAPQ